MVLFPLTFPTVARDALAKRSSPDLDILIVSLVGVVRYGNVCIMIELSTKKYPTRFMESLKMQHLKTAPCPTSLRQYIRGVLMIFHFAGAAPFLFPSPFGVGLRVRDHLSPPYVLYEYPKAILTECYKF